jgi:translation elongation factor aEF-1 beta
MGKVAITFRLMPEGLETDIDKLQEDVKGILGEYIKSMQVKPFAFGLNALYVIALVPDEKGIVDRLESSLGEIKDIQGIEVVGVDLL